MITTPRRKRDAKRYAAHVKKQLRKDKRRRAEDLVTLLQAATKAGAPLLIRPARRNHVRYTHLEALGRGRLG